MPVRAALLLLLALGCDAALAVPAPFSGCAAFPTLKEARYQVVAGNVDFNGLPMSIQRFDTRLPPEQVLAFYRRAWAPSDSSQPGPVESPAGDWKVIAIMRGECFFTVQVKSDGKSGATGFLGVSSPSEKTPLREDIPQMTGTTILNDLQHTDGPGKTARTVLLTNGFSPAANATFYQNSFTGRGWQPVSNQQMTSRAGRGSVMVFRNGLREVSVTSVREGGDTHVLLNFVDQP